MKIVAFFNNGGVGRTTLVYHLAHMLAEQGTPTLMVDLDPQSNLTAMCLPEEGLERLWPETSSHPRTVLGCVQPLLHGTGDVAPAHVEALGDRLGLIAGDPGLVAFEDVLGAAWPRALGRDEVAQRTVLAFHRLIVAAAREWSASMVLVDLGPNLGAINRASLLAADALVSPLAPDIFSVQGLRHLGRTLEHWRTLWRELLEQAPLVATDVPTPTLEPLGYVLMQVGMRLTRPTQAYRRWASRVALEFHRSILQSDEHPESIDFESGNDPWCLGIVRDYHSLMLLAQDAKKPMFQLKPADGATSAFMSAVQRCHEDFEVLAARVEARANEIPRGSGA